MTDEVINEAPHVYTRAQMMDLLLEISHTIPRHMLEDLPTQTLATGLAARTHNREIAEIANRTLQGCRAWSEDSHSEAAGAGAPFVFALDSFNAGIADETPASATEPAPEADARQNCDQCGEEFAASALRPVLSFSRRSYTTRCTVHSHVCESCGDEDDDLRTGAGINRHSSETRAAAGVGVNINTVDWYMRRDDLAYNVDAEERGTELYAESYWYCWGDGDWHSDAEESSDDDGGSCYDYSSDVTRILGWPTETAATDLCYGVELEIESKEGSSSALAEAIGGRHCERHILKYDGSLNSGCEVVTLPYSLEFHRDKFGWETLLKQAAAAGNSHNTGTCGMHVHINRAALKPLQIGKMLVFINAPGNVHYIKQIAQRDPSQWAAFKEKKLEDGNELSGSRYEAINVTRRTAEVRIFRGNLRLDRVMKNLEFCDALVHFCAHARPARLTWVHFMYWLKGTKRSYPNLRAFIAEYVKAPESKPVQEIAPDDDSIASDANPYDQPVSTEEV